MSVHPKNLLDSRNGRFLAFGCLYISEGIPYGFTATALVAFMRQQGLSIEQIGTFVAALFLPWGFKWAWAPVVDVVKMNRIGGRKAWILFCTAMMIVTLIFTALIDFQTDYRQLLVMVVLTNLFCATQDVAIDSLAVSTLREDERGRGNGFMFGGQNLGIALGGGGAVFVFGLFGFNVALIYVSGMLFVSWLFVLFFITDPYARGAERKRVAEVWSALAGTLKSFIVEVYVSFFRSGKGPRLGLLFSILPVGAMALAYAILGTLEVDYGLDTTQIAQISVYNTVAAATGCLIGGLVGDRYGLKRSLALGYCLTTVPTVYLGWLISTIGLAAIPLGTFYAIVVSHGFLFGFGFGLRAAIFMGMTNPAVAATQFTAFMAMSNVAVSISNYWQGLVAERFDYSTALYLDAVIVLLPLAVIPFLTSREEELGLQRAVEVAAVD